MSPNLLLVLCPLHSGWHFSKLFRLHELKIIIADSAIIIIYAALAAAVTRFQKYYHVLKSSMLTIHYFRTVHNTRGAIIRVQWAEAKHLQQFTPCRAPETITSILIWQFNSHVCPEPFIDLSIVPHPISSINLISFNSDTAKIKTANDAE